MLPKKLHKKIQDRKENYTFRKLTISSDLVDFSSNDYLGFSKSETIFNDTHQFLLDNNLKQNGATGSRLLSGNHKLYEVIEKDLAVCHKAESALIFNSGYDANLGLMSSVPQRSDIILYDEFSHASIRDGITLSSAKAFKFRHNDLEHLELLLAKQKIKYPDSEIYIITESVFSMDGDSPNLVELSKLCEKYKAHLIIDEAHALGVFGYGLVQELNLNVFARIVTFGKALGCHGAAVLGSNELKEYLVNFSRSFIYTTALSPHALATIKSAYKTLEHTDEIEKLSQNINFFIAELQRLNLHQKFIPSQSAIQCCVISGNENVKKIAGELVVKGFDVRPILSPTVPKRKERLRFCLHSYNSEEEISEVLQLLATFVADE